MRTVDETRIDEKCRTSALTGVVQPGERYKVSKLSDVEIRLVRMAIEKPKLPKVKIVNVNGRKILCSDHPVTNTDTEKVMAQFP